jgi:hypothetical protein
MQNYFGVDSSVLQTSAVMVRAFEVTVKIPWDGIIVATEEAGKIYFVHLCIGLP